MYRVEMILRESVEDDIIGAWLNTGRADTRVDNQIVFEQVEVFTVTNGVVFISSDKNSYWYNLADFYRVKAIKTHDENGQLSL